MNRRKQIVKLLSQITNNKFLDYIYALMKEFVRSEQADK